MTAVLIVSDLLDFLKFMFSDPSSLVIALAVITCIVAVVVFSIPKRADKKERKCTQEVNK